METILRQTENFIFVQKDNGDTFFCNRNTGRESEPKTGRKVADEINHVKHLDKEGFNSYGEMLTSID